MQIRILGVTTTLILLLGVVALTNTIESHGYADSVKILAKEKRGMILLLVKNGQELNIHGIKLTIQDKKITSVKKSQDWTETRISSNSITLTTDTAPIEMGKRAVFLLETDEVNTIISWTALDRNGLTIDTNNARTVIHFTLDTQPSDKQPSYVSSTVSSTVKTDKIYYDKNDKIFISGMMKPNKHVTITISTPNGQKMVISDNTDVTGSFNALHVLQSAESGIYHLRVSQTETYAETSFIVL